VLFRSVIFAACQGEWESFDGHSDSTISTSMDNLPGQLTAAFGLGFLASLIPILEALHTTYYDGQLLGWRAGRAVRMLIGAMAAVGLLWVVLSPISNNNLDGFVPRVRQEKWDSAHYLVAGVAFLSLYAYIVVVSLEHLSVLDSPPGVYNYIGLVLATLSMLVLVITLMLKLTKRSSDAVNQIFAASEFITVFSVFPTLIQRFRELDILELTRSIMTWGCRLKGECGPDEMAPRPDPTEPAPALL